MTAHPTALIIGASRGIGLGLARELASRSWQVTITRRGPPDPETGLLRIVGPVDITVDTDIRMLAGRLAGQKFDLIFLNAGIMAGRGQRIGDVPVDEINHTMQTNAFAPIRTAEALIGFAAPGATVAFMTSILGSIANNGDDRVELYRASKAALNSLTRSFAARHTALGLTVLSLHPGVVRSGMGGPDAPLDIETSAHGLADVLERRRGTRTHVFVDYLDRTIPW